MTEPQSPAKTVANANPLSRFWNRLDESPGLGSVRAEWRTGVGAELPFVEPFLHSRGMRSTSYPGPDGSPYEIVRHPDGRIVAVGPDVDDRIELADSDLIVYELHIRKLAESLSRALGIEFAGAIESTGTRLYRLGRISLSTANVHRCYLGFPSDAADLQAMAGRLIGSREVPFLLLLPTRRWLRLNDETIVQAQGSVFIPLAEAIVASRPGDFSLRRTLAEFVRDGRGLVSESGTSTGPAPRFSIVKLKTKWRITFEGNRADLKNLLGIRFLAHLIQFKGKRIPCYQLHALAKGQPAHEPMPGIDTIEIAGLARLRSRLREIDDEMDEAKSFLDDARQMRLEDEKKTILDQLRTSQSLDGLTRKEKSKAETLRVSVYSRIQTAIRHLEDDLPALANHLRRSILSGNEPCYAPEPDINWDVKF